MPPEMLQYKYRRMFHLTAQEFAEEPVDQLFTNLYIWGQIEKQKELINRHGNSKH